MREYTLGQIHLFYKEGAKLRASEAALQVELHAIAAQGTGKQITDTARKLRGKDGD